MRCFMVVVTLCILSMDSSAASLVVVYIVRPSLVRRLICLSSWLRYLVCCWRAVVPWGVMVNLPSSVSWMRLSRSSLPSRG